ncbi:MAG TPA: complex I subunit 1 family protein [Anaeromyxobacteraceae bacterium]|nr:complex I subunit 1 family protein [Anaeromyxobacteraceae bacterium]
MRRFLGMVLFSVAVPLSMVLLSRVVYFIDGWAEHGALYLGLPTGYGAAVANVLLLMAGVVQTTAAALTVGERKWSAMIQNRIGPNRIRILGLSAGGIFFLLADALKMITKENIEPSARSRVLYELAPMAAFAPSFVLFAVVPVGPPVDLHVGAAVHRIALQVADIDAGLLFVFGAASLAVYGTALAGWSSNSKLAILGGVRASSQMISYEVSLGLALVGAMMASQSLRLEQMVEAQGRLLFGFLPALGFFLQPIGMLIFFVSAFAETKRAPFDLPEGESEIVGYFVEYPGMKFGMMFLAEFIEVVVLAAITSAVFFGGWHPVFFEAYLKQTLSPVWFASVCAGAFLGKVLLLCWLQLVIRWTLPRFRFDQIQKLCWKMLLPAALGNVFLTGALILIDPSLELLAVVGLLEIVAVIAITGAVSRRVPAGGRTSAAREAVAAAPH